MSNVDKIKEFELDSIISLLQNIKETEIKENNNIKSFTIGFSHNKLHLKIYNEDELINEKNIEFK